MNDKMMRWFKGDEAAVNFALALWDAAQQWDDIEDEGACENHNALMEWLAFGKEYQPFFAAHAHILRPVLWSMSLQWQVANVLEHSGNRDDCDKAYMLRAGIYGVFHIMARLIGGQEWAAEVGPEIYREYGETADDLWKEFNHA